MTPVYLSLITPAFNCAGLIGDNLRVVIRELEALEKPFEILVVCDGSTDGTAAAAQRVGDPRVRILRYDRNEGKGHAIRHGIAAATGSLVGWLDADLDVHPRAIIEAARVFEQERVDCVIGSKRHPDSRVQYPVLRRLYSLGFQLLVRLLFRVNARDTQVGAKVFRREMLDTVEPLLLVKRYAFDIEVLAVGAEFGFDRIREVPVSLEYRFSGTQINAFAVRKMIQDTLAIAYRIRLRHWYVRRFAALRREQIDAL